MLSSIMADHGDCGLRIPRRPLYSRYRGISGGNKDIVEPTSILGHLGRCRVAIHLRGWRSFSSSPTRCGLGRPRTPTVLDPILHNQPRRLPITIDTELWFIVSPDILFICCRWPLACQSNFLPDAIQSGELERRFLAGALPIEHSDFQPRAFW